MSFGTRTHDDDHATEVDRGNDDGANRLWHAGCTCGWSYDGPNYWVAGNAARAHIDALLAETAQDRSAGSRENANSVTEAERGN